MRMRDMILQRRVEILRKEMKAMLTLSFGSVVRHLAKIMFLQSVYITMAFSLLALQSFESTVHDSEFSDDYASSDNEEIECVDFVRNSVLVKRKKEISLDYNNSFLGEYECSSLALDREEMRDEEEEIGSLKTRTNNVSDQ
ncbi:hypothetical protein Tco_0830847 [Tanacetum coccineum]